MENQSENPVSKFNPFSVSSLVAGLLSLLLYLPLHMDYSAPTINRMLRTPVIRILRIPFIPNNDFWGTIANAIPFPVYLFGGIVLGIIGLSFGAKALRQIKESTVEKRSRVIAITGRVLSILGIITNVLSIPIFLVQ